MKTSMMFVFLTSSAVDQYQRSQKFAESHGCDRGKQWLHRLPGTSCSFIYTAGAIKFLSALKPHAKKYIYSSTVKYSL